MERRSGVQPFTNYVFRFRYLETGAFETQPLTRQEALEAGVPAYWLDTALPPPQGGGNAACPWIRAAPLATGERRPRRSVDAAYRRATRRRLPSRMARKHASTPGRLLTRARARAILWRSLGHLGGVRMDWTVLFVIIGVVTAVGLVIWLAARSLDRCYPSAERLEETEFPRGLAQGLLALRSVRTRYRASAVGQFVFAAVLAIVGLVNASFAWRRMGPLERGPLLEQWAFSLLPYAALGVSALLFAAALWMVARTLRMRALRGLAFGGPDGWTAVFEWNEETNRFTRREGVVLNPWTRPVSSPSHACHIAQPCHAQPHHAHLGGLRRSLSDGYMPPYYVEYAEVMRLTPLAEDRRRTWSGLTAIVLESPRAERGRWGAWHSEVPERHHAAAAHQGRARGRLQRPHVHAPPAGGLHPGSRHHQRPPAAAGSLMTSSGATSRAACAARPASPARRSSPAASRSTISGNCLASRRLVTAAGGPDYALSGRGSRKRAFLTVRSPRRELWCRIARGKPGPAPWPCNALENGGPTRPPV